MTQTSTETPGAQKGGHPDTKAEMTAATNNFNNTVKGHGDIEPLDMFLLIHHDFTLSVEDGVCENIGENYAMFRKVVITIYHGAHCKEEIRSALNLAEDHLTILHEDGEDLDEEVKKFLLRAIKFIRKYTDQIGAWFEAQSKNKPVETEPQVSQIVYKEEIRWDGKFNQLVELISALILSGNVGCNNDADFIRVMLRTFGRKETVDAYHRALIKCKERQPSDEDTGLGRCKLLNKLLEDTETEWRRLDLLRKNEAKRR